MSKTKGVQIISVNQITLPPLPQQQQPIKLSFFDSLWTGMPPVQRLFLYSNPNTTLSFPSLVEALKSSLSSVLLGFLPLSGKLTYVPSTGDVEIDLSSPSVAFVEAESDLDLRLLATSEIHDVESFTKLVPVIDTRGLPFPVLAVQVTRFGCGGVAVGYSAHHTVTDGKGLMQFAKAWSATCRTLMAGSELPIYFHRPVLYDRAVIKHPKGKEFSREFLRSMVPALPSTRSSILPSVEEDRVKLTRRTFIVDAPSIQSLKQQAMQHENNNAPIQLPSTFTVFSAHVWASIVRAKCFDPKDHTFFGFLMDFRARLDPRIDEDYFGNCVRAVTAAILVGELTGENGLTHACTVIRKSINDTEKDPWSDCEHWVTDLKALLASGRLVNAASSPRFQVYETDFGWGRPDRCEMISMNRDGEFALHGGNEKGTIQMSIALDPNHMEAFTKFFLDGLSRNIFLLLHLMEEREGESRQR